MSIRATSASATSPGRSRRAMTFSPCRTSARLTPISGATSATVASATRSSIAIRSGPLLPGLAQLPVRLDQQQEHDAGGAEMAQRAVLVLPVGVHHGQRRRQGFAAQVVVEHDHIGALGRRDRLVAERAAIDADDQVVGARPASAIAGALGP